MPIETALANLTGFIYALIEHENDHKTGYGLSIPKPGAETKPANEE